MSLEHTDISRNCVLSYVMVTSLSLLLATATNTMPYPKQEALLWQRNFATRLSVEILQLQNFPFENYSPGPIVWHYLRDPTFRRFHTIPECDRHTHTDRRTDRYTTTACTALSIALRDKNQPYCTAHHILLPGNERRLIANTRQTKKSRLLSHI